MANRLKGPSPRGSFFVRGLLLTMLAFGLAGCGRGQRNNAGGDGAVRPLTVFSAASLTSTVEQTAREESLTVQLNSGGSNALVRQVQMGAQADLLLLADAELARTELEPKGYRLLPLASNQLVLVSPASRSNPTPDEDFQAVLRAATELAIADPKTAPLGGYTEEALKGLSLQARRLPLQDAQAVLSAVALGHAGLGVVYRSDALSEKGVTIVAAIPSERHRPVVYVAALPKDNRPEAQLLVDSLIRGKGRALLDKRGFLPPTVPAARQAQ